MNAGNEPEMNEELEMNNKKNVEMNPLLQSGFATITDHKNLCYNPQQRPITLQAFDIIDKCKDLESEIPCEILEQLITHFKEVQEYIVDNYIDLIIEED